MSARIDHVAKALDLLPAPGAGMLPTHIALAHVHATLALVEQQRIANLIEVVTWNQEALRRDARKVGDEPYTVETELARIGAIVAEVQKGLGLS